MSAIDTGERRDWPAWTVGHRIALGPREGLTATQEAVLGLIEHAWLERRPCPTLRDIMAELGLKSTSAARCHLRPLAAKGWIELQPGGLARSIRLAAKAVARLRVGPPDPPPPPRPGLKPSRARVLGLIVAAAAERRPAPTFREIAAAMGWRSPNTATGHVRALAALGLVGRAAGKSRAIRPTAKALGQQP